MSNECPFNSLSAYAAALEFDASVSVWVQQNDSIYATAKSVLPVALSRIFVLWHEYISKLYCCTISCKLLGDFCLKLLEF